MELLSVALPANVRLIKKCLPMANTLAYCSKVSATTMRRIVGQFYKTFLSVIYQFSLYTGIFVPSKLFQPCLMFAGKARSLPYKVLTGTNTLSYYENSYITDKKVLQHWPQVPGIGMGLFKMDGWAK